MHARYGIPHFLSLFAVSIAFSGTPGRTTPPDLRNALVAGSQAFAFDLYGRLKSEKGNLFFSPFSISTALAMTYAGARGATETQMAGVLHLQGAQAAIHPVFGRLIADLNRAGAAGDFELGVANGLWGQEGFSFGKEFLDLVRTSYDAGFREVDFRADPDGVRLEVNAWVEQKTRSKIKDLFPKGSIVDMTRLILANAIYFKGKWETEFSPEYTRPAPFTLLAGKRVDVPTMNRLGRVQYAETTDLQVAVLPYRGNALSMAILLPRQERGIQRLEEMLTAEYLSTLLSDLGDREASLSIPKFTVTQSFALAETLRGMGMKDLFAPDTADLSGMNGRKDLFVSAVVHKAFVDVNEEGTEAAAATGVAVQEMESVGPPPVEFRADRPFVFLIRDNTSGAILFLGRIENPLEQN